jgi:CubicO group peptidase (beta-lactamase class C family)
MPARAKGPPDEARLRAVRDRLVRRGHVEPVVAVSTPQGRMCAGDPGERFEIGSVTKVFTALLLAVLAESGTVRLDDRVVGYLPAGIPAAPGVADITLEHLASHRSGLPRLPPGLWRRGWSQRAAKDPYADQDAQTLYAGLAKVRVRGTPGATRIRYSNLGAGLLGHALGRATGSGYRAALLTHVVAPLGLGATSFQDAPLHQGRTRRGPVGPWHLAELAGAGELRSTAADLLTFLEAVRDRSGPLASAIAETLRPRAAGRFGIGLGWFLVARGEVLMHDGGTLGARSQVRVERATGTCVVVLGDGRGGTARAAGALLRPSRRPGRA